MMKKLRLLLILAGLAMAMTNTARGSDSDLKNAVLLGFSDGSEKDAVGVGAAGPRLTPTFNTSKPAAVMRLLWPGNEPAELDRLAGE